MTIDILVVKLHPRRFWSIIPKIYIESFKLNSGIRRQVLKAHRLEPAVSSVLANDVVPCGVQYALTSNSVIADVLAVL